MRLEWDKVKAESNFQKHGVSFSEAATVFRDTLSITGADPDHSEHDLRVVTFGNSNTGRLLTVSHTDEGEDVIRIISARLATKMERRLYEEG